MTTQATNKFDGPRAYGFRSTFIPPSISLARGAFGQTKPEIPGYVTQERCAAEVAVADTRRLVWAAAALFVGMAAGALVTVAVATSTKG